MRSNIEEVREEWRRVSQAQKVYRIDLVPYPKLSR